MFSLGCPFRDLNTKGYSDNCAIGEKAINNNRLISFLIRLVLLNIPISGDKSADIGNI